MKKLREQNVAKIFASRLWLLTPVTFKFLSSLGDLIDEQNSKFWSVTFFLSTHFPSFFLEESEINVVLVRLVWGNLCLIKKYRSARHLIPATSFIKNASGKCATCATFSSRNIFWQKGNLYIFIILNVTLYGDLKIHAIKQHNVWKEDLCAWVKSKETKMLNFRHW